MTKVLHLCSMKFCLLVMMVVAQICACDKMTQKLYTHIAPMSLSWP